MKKTHLTPEENGFYGCHNYPLERVEDAVAWLLGHGNSKVGIAGASAMGTHFVFPQTMLTTALPLFSGAFVKLAFSAARKHPKECRETREDIDGTVRDAIAKWLQM